ncbi:MAG: transglycosylase SLT domain-containing protein, partial [Candidatus Aegiribacteria sp.]|nr:transglycosylase SLT domain-containing protein [Candidatus Aegiribacteria sp.]MBD3295089.1 transglycosylase SLT domain-containing protein [Candidatus Fermentibacteria bacterium]
LRTPGDSVRNELVWKAASVSDSMSVLTAQLLLESSDSLAPYRALQLGGAEVAEELLSSVSRYGAVMPEYLMMVLADSLLNSGDVELAHSVLQRVPQGLPERAERHRLVLDYRALLSIGWQDKADSVQEAVGSGGDEELLSLLTHHKAMFMKRNGEQGYTDMFVQSFQLWPAAPVHAAAYSDLRSDILADASLAARVADPFYSGGLWNELYDIAINADDPDPHLHYLAARTRDRLGFYDTAVDMLEEYLEEWPDGEDAANATIYLGRNLGRTGNWQAGFDVLREYGASYPDHYRIGNLPWYIGDLFAENRQWERAVPWFRKTLSDYPFNVTADDAHFYLCFSLLKSGDVTEAVEELQNFTSRWTGSVYYDSARYWLGKLLYTEGNPQGSRILSNLIESSPTSLPAYFARELMGLPPWEPTFTEEPLAEWMTRHGHSPATPPEEAYRGLFLVMAGLRHFADGEFRRAEDLVGGPDLLAPFYLKNGIWERRPISGYRMWDLSDLPDDRPRELWMLRYQMAWPELVSGFGEKYGLDSLFAWAIVRNESMFQPTCYSVAGARGLIQMIPSTSEYVALENGWEDYSPDRLYEPEVSLEYGISYISGVYEDFGGDPVKTAAAYNGGPHNAVHWGGLDMETDEFFALITYNETKNYTQNVHHAWQIYKSLYSN